MTGRQYAAAIERTIDLSPTGERMEKRANETRIITSNDEGDVDEGAQMRCHEVRFGETSPTKGDDWWKETDLAEVSRRANDGALTVDGETSEGCETIGLEDGKRSRKR